MPIKRTDKYQLSQWEKSDRVLMEDFNADNLNIENALAGLEASKAAAADLAALKTEVAAKAASAVLTDLQNTVAGKADRSELTALQNTVAQLSAQLAALQAEAPRVAAGTYQGDGTENRFIDVGFTPKAVFVFNQYGGTYFYNSSGRYSYFGGLAVPGGPTTTASYNGSYLTVLAAVANGFTVTYGTMSTNGSPITASANSTGNFYQYLAIG